LAARGRAVRAHHLDRLPQKAFDTRRDPRVSLLFGYPRRAVWGTSAVLVQGDAESPDEPQQPARVSAPDLRLRTGWYYMLLYIHVRPRRILIWSEGDFTKAPLKVDHVG
jgi:hypothetical protein